MERKLVTCDYKISSQPITTANRHSVIPSINKLNGSQQIQANTVLKYKQTLNQSKTFLAFNQYTFCSEIDGDVKCCNIFNLSLLIIFYPLSAADHRHVR